MVLIEMITLSAGPAGVREAGSRHRVSEEEAAALVAAGAARILGMDAPPRKREPEAAVVVPEENAVLPSARGRRRGR